MLSVPEVRLSYPSGAAAIYKEGKSPLPYAAKSLTNYAGLGIALTNTPNTIDAYLATADSRLKIYFIYLMDEQYAVPARHFKRACR